MPDQIHGFIFALIFSFFLKRAVQLSIREITGRTKKWKFGLGGGKTLILIGRREKFQNQHLSDIS